MFALVDCNNFYCSCERLFNPKLNKHPIVVLSNNDGCVIARSEEAKALGIVMGTPEHLVRELIKKHNVAVFSSNYTLYGDMSDRVMKMLASLIPQIELYSIDEAFLDVGSIKKPELYKWSSGVKEKVMRSIGIPVTLGVAATKTLAKMANRHAKTFEKANGVYVIGDEAQRQKILQRTAVGDIWGIGHINAAFLTRQNIKTAWDFSICPDDWVRKHLHVTGLRMKTELNGMVCKEIDEDIARKKNICTSRAFSTFSEDKHFIAEAISNHIATTAVKLRSDATLARTLEVFILTNQFRTQDQQYSHSITMKLDVPTSDTGELIGYAMKGLDIIFRSGLKFMKCGIVVSDLIPENTVQQSFTDNRDRNKSKIVMSTLDSVNKALGKDALKFATQGFEKRYLMKTQYLSPRYTTRINEVVHIKN